MPIWSRLGFLLAIMASSAPAYAILSCDAGAGQTVSGGAFDACNPLSGKFSALAESDYGNAAVDASSGSMSGIVAVSTTTISDGRFYGNLVADFRIDGPAPTSGLPVSFIYSTSGGIDAVCTNCEANISFSHRIDSVTFSGFQIQTSGGRTLSSDWTVNTSSFDTSGLNLNPTATKAILVDGGLGTLTFDAAMVVGHTFRLTSNLSGHAHLTGVNPPGASLVVDGGHTALFNILLPDGYTLSASPSHYPFLSDPILQAVPEPSTYALMLVGLGLVGVAARRRMRA